MADGRLLEFPDGTDPAVIQSTVKKMLPPIPAPRPGGPAAPAVAAPGGGAAVPVGAAAQPRVGNAVGIPEMVTDTGEPSALERFGQAAFSPETFQAAGGMAGAALGTPLGVPGALAGGALGAAAGQSAFDVAQRARAALGGEPAPDTTVGQEALQAGQAGLTDLAFGGAGAVAGPLVKSFKPALGRLLGVSGQPAKAVVEEATKQGIPLAAAQVSQKPSVKNFSQVIGVFPYVGTPFKRLAAGTSQAIDSRTTAILNELAPTATAADLGVDLTNAAKGRFKDTARVGGALYKDFTDKAIAAGNPSIVPTDTMRQVANSLLEQQAQGRVFVPGARGQTRTNIVPEELGNPLDKFFQNFVNVPERLTVLQARGLQRSLNDATKLAKAQGFDVSRAAQIKQALEQDLNNLDVGNLAPDVGAPIVKALQNANTFWAREMTAFETPTAKRFGRVDRNIFSPKFAQAGGTNADEAFRAVVNSRSPQAMADLRRLVGDDVMKGVARRNVEDAFAKATATGAQKGSSLSFDPENLAQNLGLNSADGRRVLAESLKGTPISVDDLEKFVDVTRVASDFNVPDVSTFLQRRLTLGGLRSLLATGVAGVGITQAPLTALGMGVLARKGSQILASPTALKSMTKALDDSLTDKVRRAALLRVGAAVLPDDESVPEAPF